MSALYAEIIGRFTDACRSDERVIACFLGGSNARGTADAFSDLDLYLITTDEAHEQFCAEYATFLKNLGEPLFALSWARPEMVFFILADGTEGELGIGKASAFRHIHGGPHQVLLDKTGILEGVEFSESESSPEEQTELLRRVIAWFWHDVSHLITALGRGQLWWAMGQVEILRSACIKLARLEQNFLDAEIGDEPYFKLDKHISTEAIVELEATFCPLDRGAIVDAARTLLVFYKQHALALAIRHNIPYPTRLELVMIERFERLAES